MHHFSLASISLKGTSPPPETMHLKTLFYWKLRRTQYFVSTQTELRTATQTEPGPFPHALVYKYGHYEASFPKHFISITLFLQAHIVMFIYLFVCLLLVYFMEAAFIGCISSILCRESIMARPPKTRRLWIREEDDELKHFKTEYPNLPWGEIKKLANLQDRDEKSCSHRWNNYLRPDINKGEFFPQEDELIIHLKSLGVR